MLRNRSDLKARLHKLIDDARPFVPGRYVEIGGRDPKDRVDKTRPTLVEKVYVNLPLLRALSYFEAHMGRSLREAEGLFGCECSGLMEAEQEILNFGNSQAKLGVRVTVS